MLGGGGELFFSCFFFEKCWKSSETFGWWGRTEISIFLMGFKKYWKLSKTSEVTDIPYFFFFCGVTAGGREGGVTALSPVCFQLYSGFFAFREVSRKLWHLLV